MALENTLNNDTGFGNDPSRVGGRFINRDGTFNVRKNGNRFFERFSLFHSMLNLPLWKFLLALLAAYTTINLFFTAIYLLIGPQEFMGMMHNDYWGYVKEIYFFSTQTFTTVGYGRVNPTGDFANFVASIEAMMGFISFAVVTGLIYGRFAKPKAFLVFSDHAVVAPYRDISGLMFRFASYKDRHTLTDVEVKVNLARLDTGGEDSSYQFYELALERSRVDTLPMNWTVVHPINEQSPLKGLTREDFERTDVEIYVMVRGFDDVYSNYVTQRTSYIWSEIQFNRRFVPMYKESNDGKITVVELHKISRSEEVEFVI